MKNKQKTLLKPKPNDLAGSSAVVEDKIWKDPRFEHLVSDPRFRGIHKATQKIKIDKRFESMFNDDKFKVKYTVDKYGRPVNKSSSEDLKKYYDLSSENEEEEQVKEAAAIVKDDKVDDGNDELDSDQEIPVTLKAKLKDLNVDYARGEGTLLSEDSSDDESSDDGEEDEMFIEHVWGELDVDAPRTDESTRRLAVCNMDWDRIRAADIMVLCHSFLPPAGVIMSVTIYPSEYGKERMAEEEVKGPQELTEKKLDSSDEDADNSDDEGGKAVVDEAEEGAEYNMEKLRQYQLNRLKYFYAVIECNNVATADKIYAECDGLEYESTATKLDIRFIPDEMTFDDEPKDTCTELPDTTKYMPRLFTTTALQQAKVELTWDENDLERKEMNDKLMSGKLNDVGDQELRKYVAYSSEEEDDEEKPMMKTKKGKRAEQDSSEDDSDEEREQSAKKDPIDKYKALLADINQKEAEKKSNRIEMEFSWGINTKDRKSDVVNDELKNSKQKKDPEKTHFDKILELKKEKKKARKVEQKKLRKKFRKGADPDASSDDDNSNSDDDEDLPDGVDLNDPYFAEEFDNGEFEAPKKSKKKPIKKRRDDGPDSAEEQRQAELALLLDDGDAGDNRPHFSLKKIQDTENESKTKRRKKKMLRRSKKQNEADKVLLAEDDFQINTGDNRFAAVYSSHLYNIDPTNPNFKKTKGMEAFIGEKLKRRPAEGGFEDASVPPVTKKTKRNVENSLLVKSIKRKVAQQ